MAIGAGTMIGAGIFLFPGLAGGKAGMAAVLSFALGAGIALLVALPASELVSAMPRSGGGYHYVSRGLGPLPGTLVGVGQWFGLVFASAFYLAGFGQYLHELLHRHIPGMVPPERWIAFIASILITGIAVVGTQKAGKLQNATVGLLLVVLGGFLAYGLAGILTHGGSPVSPDRRFAPRGLGAVIPTAALVFTSYLGFIQITTVAGDIKRAGRTAPRAMLGSIGMVAILYVLTLFVATSVLSADRLEELGETALPEVARAVLGEFGALVVLGAGLLATLSSANASILGSSRSVFALGRDAILPDSVGRISERYGTPHWALLLAGFPVAIIVLFGRLEILAEVASILHLFMYGMICLSLFAFRRRGPEKHRPEFRTPAYPWLPALGAIASFGLVAWMELQALVLSGVVLLGALLWHLGYSRGVEFSEKRNRGEADTV
jgi:amino acid transporter